MIAIDLAPELDEKLELLAQETGRTKSAVAEQAIKEFLEDREDDLLGVAVLERGEGRTSMGDLRKELDLER